MNKLKHALCEKCGVIYACGQSHRCKHKGIASLPPWFDHVFAEILRRIGEKVRDGGRIEISPDRLLDLWQQNRVKLLLDHGVPFTIECTECQDCASGDPVQSYAQALDLGWSQIEPAAPDLETSHFFGLCPQHTAEAAKGGG